MPAENNENSWKARLRSYTDVGNGTVDVQVEYYQSEKSFIRSYNLHPEQFNTTEAFTEFIRVEAEKIDNFYSVASTIESFVGNDIF